MQYLASMNFSPRQTKPQKGFVLLSVLIIATLLISFASAIIYAINQQLELAELSDASFRDKLAIDNQYNELLYLLTTQRITVGGVSKGYINSVPEDPIFALKDRSIDTEPRSFFHIEGNEIRIDGKVYLETVDDRQISYSIQEATGLISVNNREHFWLKYFLRKQNVSAYNSNRFSDLIIDYADEDHLRQPLGAESNRYDKSQLVPNFLIQHCSELNKIALQFELPIQTLELSKFCNLTRRPSLNINTVPEDLIAIMWPEAREKIMADRERGNWIIRFEDAYKYSFSLLKVPDEFVATIGRRTFIVKLDAGAIGLIRQIEVGGKNAPPFTIKPLN